MKPKPNLIGGEAALHETFTDEAIQSGLGKLESVGLIKRSGKVYGLPGPLQTLYPLVREITNRYGELKGVEAVVLGVVPPALEMKPMSFQEIKGTLLLAQAMHKEAFHGR
jgi:hypothetical protein